MRALIAAFLSLVLIAACELPFGLSGSAPPNIGIRLEADGVRLRNPTSAVVHYQVIGSNSILDWVPCVRSDCPHLEAGEGVLVPFSAIPGAESPTIEVYWWRRTDGELADWSDVRKVDLRR